MSTQQEDQSSSSNSEVDKFQIFEQWLRINGAQFPLLELRKYEDTTPPNNSEEEMHRRRSRTTDEENEAEEKKDQDAQQHGGSISINNESTNGVANMSLHDNNNSTQQQQEEDDGSKEMRGVHARTNIPPQTVCVSIPKSCLITVEMGQATPIGRKILSSDLELDAPKHIYLMIFLLWDKKLHGNESFFAPYYNILPQSMRNMPIFWNESELSLLKGSHLLAQIADRAEAIQDDYNSILSVAPEFATIATLEEFQWARMIVCSRNFGLLINGHRTSALVPHADMLNHFRPRETKWTFCEETQCFTITTLQSIQCGAQVYDSYGQKCNHRFLLNYGFCVERNVEIDGFCPNEVPLEIGLDLVAVVEGIAARGGGGGDETNNNNNDRECWEKKAAFWCRGEGSAMQSYQALFSSGSSSAATDIGGDTGLSFQAIAATVAGSPSSAVGAQGIATTSSALPADNIMQTMAAMTDAPTTAALTEARRMSQHQQPQHRHPTICPIKRVRVCVSNNENTRILFSMLRVLACNLAEIDRISLGGRLTNISGLSSLTTSAAQRLFGVHTPESAGVSSSATSSLRTCRDIRYPINLRNERRAMEILLEIIARTLSKYPTSLAQDTADLQDEMTYPKYSNRRNAKLQVRGEKEVLHHFALWARTSMHVIDIILYECEIEKKLLVSSSLSSLARNGADNNDDTVVNQNEELGYDYVIQAMEDDDDCHTTILRYCSDVLGAVRRDELMRAANSVINFDTTHK